MSEFRQKIAAVVVLYYPGLDVVTNVRSWAGQVTAVYAVGNSGPASETLVEAMSAIPNVHSFPQDENLGIATALNIGAERALADGYDFLLTMDQDSSASPGMVAKMLRCVHGEEGGKVGIISPFHVTKSGARPPVGVSCQEVMTPMTSGCLLNLESYRAIGPFRDDLFIDFVDNEYCLRLRKHGYRVLRANEALLQHSAGDIRKYGPFIATNHSPLRRYYKTRNRFWVFREYVRDFPGHCLFDLVRLMKEIASIVLFETEKLSKLCMMWRGFKDFLRDVRGRYAG